MNKKMVIHTLGRMCMLEAVFLLFPVIPGLIYGNNSIFAFLISSGIALVTGLLMYFLAKPADRTIYSKEGFIVCALTWIIMSLFGALPFYLSREIPSYVDCFFETVSGFTTTGATILNNIEALSEAVLFWRSFTHFLGGMGVLVFMTMLSGNRHDRTMHIMKAEMPGPIVDKLVPRTKDTARILYIIYIVLTFIEFVFLLCGEMNVFEAVLFSMSTAGTGGFATLGSSAATFGAYTQWVFTVFMFLFGVNFNIYFMLLLKKYKSVLKSEELWTYFGIIVSVSIIIAFNTRGIYPDISEGVRACAFQVTSIMTTTGFVTTDFNLWPQLSKTLLIVLMFFGACAGSTAGGFKLSRVIIMFRSLGRELSLMKHPRTVKTVHFEGKRLGEETVKGVHVYLSAYFVCFLAIFLLLSFDRYDTGTNFVLTMTTFNNVGPAMSSLSAFDSFSSLTAFSKIVLSFSMLLGRLEIFPLVLTFAPSTWSAKH